MFSKSPPLFSEDPKGENQKLLSKEFCSLKEQQPSKRHQDKCTLSLEISKICVIKLKKCIQMVQLSSSQNIPELR